MIGTVEARLPVAVRRNRALALAVEELGAGELEEIVSLASAICNLRVWPDAAIDYFRGEPGQYDIRQSHGLTTIRLKPANAGG